MMRLHCSLLCIARFVFTIALMFSSLAVAPQLASALEPPPPGMIDQMRRAGTLDAALERAKALGTYKMRLPKRGQALPAATTPSAVAEQIMRHFGESLDQPKSGKAVSAMSQAELSFAQLDLNHDRVVDERDILALGYPQPKDTASLPALGTVKAFCLFIDFPDYPKWFDPAELDFRLFDQGDTSVEYRSLQWYYEQASYNNLTIEGDVYQHRASHNRTYYHPNDNNTYDTDSARRDELVTEAIQAANTGGADFSQYDNDGDGAVDYFLVVYTGPVGAWLSYWWGNFGSGLPGSFVVDGVSFPAYSWQWEQLYGFEDSPPNPPNWDPYVTIHETGHSLGLPDLYDYDENQGPDGGVGGLDMMDGNWGDHNCFSKYVLGWVAPTIAFSNFNDEPLDKSYAVADAVVFMPGFDPVSPWSEYFMAQYRFRAGVDQTYPADGMLLWHIDSRVSRQGWFDWNNSYTSHKLLRLMEADGLEQIENGGNVNGGDFYQSGKVLSPTSTPNSNKYDGTNPGITCNDFSAPGIQMTADFTMYTSNPPQVNITAPNAGDTVSGNNVTITIEASDDVNISKVQLIIDGQLVNTWTSWSSPASYSWNTLVEFNKTLNITARAWDVEDQAGSATISVTVSNSGVSSINDAFDDGLANWRSINYPDIIEGSYTEWMYRSSPASPPPLGSGNEAYVNAPTGVSSKCWDGLRSQRIDASTYSRWVRIKFFYRCRTGATLLVSTDNGTSWTCLATVPSWSSWTTFDQYFEQLQGETFYLMFFYEGSASTSDTFLGYNVDNVIIQELPSDLPVVTITSPADGATVSGTVVVNADATDDGSVTQVRFYMNNSLKYTDNSAPWQYSRDTTSWDDNHPALPVKAVATDNDGLVGLPSEITVVLNNARTYPVYEDLETHSNWTTSNLGSTPDWVWVANLGHSGTHSYAWEVTGSSYGATSDDVTYTGRADLASDSVDSPALRFYYQGDLPTNATMKVYFVNTWTGDHLLGTVTTDQASWSEIEYLLNSYLGYSGRIKFTASMSIISGTGIWIDDLRVENRLPYINSISPARGEEGMTQTIAGLSFGLSRVAGSIVTFGGGVNAADADYVSWGNSQIQVKIPAGAVSGDVTVTVASQTSNGVRVAVVLAPPSLQNLVQQ